MESLDPESLAKMLESALKSISESLKHISEITKTISDNKTKLKLEAIKNNSEMVKVKLGILNIAIANKSNITDELIKDIFSTCDFVMRINYNILEIVGSETREKNSEKIVDGIISFAKENPYIFIAPISLPASILGALGTGVNQLIKKSKKKIS